MQEEDSLPHGVDETTVRSDLTAAELAVADDRETIEVVAQLAIDE
jgi:hypothetical protein